MNMDMRKHYIDNIRIICILLLFPYHTFMLYNTFHEPFYVYCRPIQVLTEFMIMVFPWWMTLLFTIAGISSAYALKKRSGKEYANERISKLLTPLFFGMLLVIPIQSYIADVFHNNYTGSYFEHYQVYFTRFTDLTGYDGGFTPAHTWFMLYLFIISMAALPLMLWYNKRAKKIDGGKITMPILLPMFLGILLLTPILEISGKSIGESLACFLLGFFLLSHDEVQEKLMKFRIPLSIAWIALMIIRNLMYANNQDSGLIWDIEQRMLTWFGILAILGMGKKYLNFNNKFTRYLSPAAFPIYYFHQSILVLVAFFVLKITNLVPVQIGSIILISFILTILSYEIFRHFTATCYMFGIKKKVK